MAQEQDKLDHETVESQADAIAAVRARLSADESLLALEADGYDASDPSASLRDEDVLRFLIARELDVEKASRLAAGFVKWEKETRPDWIGDREVRRDLEMQKAFLHGRDKQGRPVLWADAGKHDAYNRVLEESMRYTIRRLRELESLMTEDAQQFVVVIDFQNYGWGNMDIEGSKRQLYVLDRYFAERVGHLYLINTGWVFWALWKVVGPLIPARTRKKVHLLRNADAYEPIFKEQFDADVLPAKYGGNNEFAYSYSYPGDDLNAVPSPVIEGEHDGEDVDAPLDAE